MSAAQLAAMLQAGAFRWHCTPDRDGAWDYLCSQAQLREVKGYDVNGSQIIRTDTLVYAGQTLTTP